MKVTKQVENVKTAPVSYSQNTHQFIAIVSSYVVLIKEIKCNLLRIRQYHLCRAKIFAQLNL